MSDNAQQPDMTPGIFSWNELASNDVAGSTKFYTELFGWTPQSMPMAPAAPPYIFFTLNGRPAAGLLTMPPEAKGAPTMWIGYVTVADLPAAVEKARALGAKVCRDITQIPMGRFALLSDPQGAMIGLWEFAKAQ